MCSSTDSLDSSLVLNEPGSSSTSPSRFPRMLVENQPASPSIRAFSPGARMVLMSVCPVLKSFPQMGALFLRESRSEEHTSELQSQSNLVCRLLLEKKKP